MNLDDQTSITNSLTQYGFFYYPIDGDTNKAMDGIVEYAKDYFSCSNEIKMKQLIDKTGIGYSPLMALKLHPDKIDMKESYSYRINTTDNHLLNRHYQLMSSIAKKIFIKILETINMDPTDYVNKALGTLTLIHYPVLKDAMQNVVGCSEHTDWGFITLLYTTTSGLQIKVDDDWIDVPMKENHLIVNIGNMLELLSGSRYKSTEHRVTTQKEKYSVAYFFEPGLDCIISSPSGDKLVNFGEYLQNKLKTHYWDN